MIVVSSVAYCGVVVGVDVMKVGCLAYLFLLEKKTFVVVCFVVFRFAFTLLNDFCPSCRL